MVWIATRFVGRAGKHPIHTETGVLRVMDKTNLLSKLQSLAPWHFDIPVGHGLRTIDGNRTTYEISDKVGVSAISTDSIRGLLKQLYPNGLADRSFLDAGCNGGAYCFLAQELGASRIVGFDVREHWIDQANLLLSILDTKGSDMQFLVRHIHEFEESESQFDVTLFKGVFYHLPNPIAALEKLCSLTNELIIIDTASIQGVPSNCLVTNFEDQTQVMSGVDRLAWIPGGPQAIVDILSWLKFPEFRVDFEKVEWPGGKANWGRFRIIAARHAEILANYDASVAKHKVTAA
jgi:2-polyprenyl-3-methyl-5-hydroxy-6-metoxy-1,4-benzoquinol methylase